MTKHTITEVHKARDLFGAQRQDTGCWSQCILLVLYHHWMLWSLVSWRNCEVWSAKCLFEKVGRNWALPVGSSWKHFRAFHKLVVKLQWCFYFSPWEIGEMIQFDWLVLLKLGWFNHQLDRCVHDDSKGIPKSYLAENAFKRRWSNLIAIPMSFYVWCTTCHVNKYQLTLNILYLRSYRTLLLMFMNLWVPE